MSLPPLRQSTAELLACDELYVAQVIDGKEVPDSLNSERGTSFHDVMWKYITHCKQRQIPSDWAALDRFAAAVGVEARVIARAMRDHYIVDHQHSLGAELTLYLDEHFQPTQSKTPRFQVTLDHLVAHETVGLIEDFKTHPGPFEATTIQAHMYPLVVFQTYGFLDQVTFKLIFSRYRNVTRSVTFSRSQVPELIEYVSTFAALQEDVHRRAAKDRKLLRALPGNHCQYCPLLRTLTCPIAEFNEHATHTPEEWLKFIVWADKVKALGKEVLRSNVGATEKPVVYRDGHGDPYEFGPWPTATVSFPLIETNDILRKWDQQMGEELRKKLVVGTTELKPLLKAMKRKDLADELANVATPEPGVRWGIRVAGKEAEEEGDVQRQNLLL